MARRLTSPLTSVPDRSGFPLRSNLLDKSVVRETLRAVQRLLFGQPLPDRQFFSFTAVVGVLDQHIPIYITEQLLHILSQPHTFHVPQVLLPRFHVLKAGRYLRRWARRLRKEGFSREDALLVSYASFGVDAERGVSGTEVVLTTDFALKTCYEGHFVYLTQRFERMTWQLQPPYRNATLPTVLTPEETVEALLG